MIPGYYKIEKLEGIDEDVLIREDYSIEEFLDTWIHAIDGNVTFFKEGIKGIMTILN